MEIEGWHNYFFRIALEKSEECDSLAKEDKNKDSWMTSLAARCYFFCHVIASILYLPIGLCGTLYGLIKSAVTWKKADELSFAGTLWDKINQIALGLFGFIVSPVLASQNTDEHWGVFLMAGVAFSALAATGLSTHLYSSLNPMKFHPLGA